MARPGRDHMHRSFIDISFTRLKRATFAAVLGLLVAAAAFGQTSGGLKGKVRNSRGTGIPEATVTARQNGADVKTATANGKGEFVLDGLNAGVYNLVFDAKGYASGVLYNVEVKKNKVNDLGERLILAPDQGSLVIVKGSVFFKNGTSVVGAQVEIARVNADGSVKKVASGTTNISGEFTYRQPEGTAKLRVTAIYNKTTASKDIEVSEPAIYRLAISLDIDRDAKP